MKTVSQNQIEVNMKTWKQKIDEGLDATIHPAHGPKWITIKSYWNRYRVRTPWDEIECNYEDLEKIINDLKNETL